MTCNTKLIRVFPEHLWEIPFTVRSMASSTGDLAPLIKGEAAWRVVCRFHADEMFSHTSSVRMTPGAEVRQRAY